MRRSLVPRNLVVATCVTLFAGGCASAPAAPPPGPPTAAATSATTGAALPVPAGYRWNVEPVPVARSFTDAIDRGTRTDRGVPGPNYWTQRVSYLIDAALDPESATITGSGIITYENNSPDDLNLLVLRLYQNVFAPGAQRSRDVSVTGGITVERVALQGVDLGQVDSPTRSSYLIDGTLMVVYLDAPLGPGGTVDLEVDWSYEVVEGGEMRQGRIGRELYNIAQWYPQVAVYDDLNGWHTWPYLGNGEFYLEYGDFNVSITVPEGWIVGASGTLQNAPEILAPDAVFRLLQATTTDEVIAVVSAEDLAAGRATLPNPTGFHTWRFMAEQVRDFAFATSNEYVWAATRAITPDADGDGEPENVAIHSFYRPDISSWLDSAEYIRHAVAFHAERWHPYPWPQMTGAEGPVGGMEYPMLTFVRDFGDGRSVYETLNHEIGHMWFPMMVGSNEPSYPWMDEGLTTYIEGYATGDYWDDPEYWRNDQDAYLMVAGIEQETPIMRHADLHGPEGTYSFAAYWKPATLLRALETVIGQETVWESLRAYADAWMYRHPDPVDFFNTVERVAGRDLDWFWHPFWYETGYLDQAVLGVEIVGSEARVTVGDEGSAPMPATVQVTLSSGEALREAVPVEAWLAGAREQVVTFSIPGGASVDLVEVDPDVVLPDVNRDNNVWER